MTERAELSTLARGIQRLWWLVAGLALLGGVVAVTASALTTPVYQATTSILVGETRYATQIDTRALKAGQSIARTYADIIGRRPVMESVVQDLELRTGWQELAEQVRVQLPDDDPQLIVVTVEDHSPRRAAAIARAIADELLAVSSSRTAAKRRDFVAGQLAGLERRIEEGDKRVADLRKRHRAADTAAERVDLQGQIDDVEETIQDWQKNYADLAGLTPPDSASTSVEILEKAHAAPSPVSPQTNRNVLLSVALGLMLAVPIVYLLQRRRERRKAKPPTPAARDPRPETHDESVRLRQPVAAGTAKERAR